MAPYLTSGSLILSSFPRPSTQSRTALYHNPYCITNLIISPHFKPFNNPQKKAGTQPSVISTCCYSHSWSPDGPSAWNMLLHPALGLPVRTGSTFKTQVQGYNLYKTSLAGYLGKGLYHSTLCKLLSCTLTYCSLE